MVKFLHLIHKYRNNTLSQYKVSHPHRASAVRVTKGVQSRRRRAPEHRKFGFRSRRARRSRGDRGPGRRVSSYVSYIALDVSAMMAPFDPHSRSTLSPFGGRVMWTRRSLSWPRISWQGDMRE